MKKIILLIGILVFVFTMHAFREADRKFADILSQLGVKQEEGKDYIFASFIHSYFQYPSNKTIKSLTFPKRAEVAKELAAYTKKYLLSPEFKKSYKERRELMIPKSPEEDVNPDKKMKERAKELARDIKESEEMVKATKDAKLKPILEKELVRQKEMLKSLTDPSHKDYAQAREGYQGEYDWKMKEYKDQLEKFNKTHPDNPNDLIKDRLQKFLEISAEVDYNAELKEGYGGKKVFVNPKYEKKSNDWKACYRAGKETVAVVRAEAEKFLKELK